MFTISTVAFSTIFFMDPNRRVRILEKLLAVSNRSLEAVLTARVADPDRRVRIRALLVISNTDFSDNRVYYIYSILFVLSFWIRTDESGS